MKNINGRILGMCGSDILAAGDYKISDGSLKNPIYAVEYCGANTTITATKDENGRALNQVFVTGDGVAITSDIGLMMFREDVHEFTCDAVVKVWYAK